MVATQMTTDKESSRQAFEKWFTTMRQEHKIIAGHEISRSEYDFMYQAWQAAIAAMGASIPRASGDTSPGFATRKDAVSEASASDITPGPDAYGMYPEKPSEISDNDAIHTAIRNVLNSRGEFDTTGSMVVGIFSAIHPYLRTTEPLEHNCRYRDALDTAHKVFGAECDQMQKRLTEPVSVSLEKCYETLFANKHHNGSVNDAIALAKAVLEAAQVKYE